MYVRGSSYWSTGEVAKISGKIRISTVKMITIECVSLNVHEWISGKHVLLATLRIRMRHLVLVR